MAGSGHARRPKPATPDHYYTADGIVPVEASSAPKPDDDPTASRGIPVFRPSLGDFNDFERYMNAVEPWGMKSGIVKIIPPKEWRDALPSVVPQLEPVRVKNPIEQDIVGTAGLFRVQNIERRRHMSVREWYELCARDEMRTPGILDGDRRARPQTAIPRSARSRRSKTAAAAASVTAPSTPAPDDSTAHDDADENEHERDQDHDHDGMDVDTQSVQADGDGGSAKLAHTTGGRRSYKERMEARHERDTAFLAAFEPHIAWLPPGTTADDYTPEFCRALERMYWRSLGLGRAAWYGADSAGSLFTDTTEHWNVAKLPSLLTRLLPSGSALPGVNTPYLYFGMWRATFAWHVEDMDLFSINYIHFGAPKHWYAIPQARAAAFEQIMKSNFPSDISQCPQFLRHKAFLVSPTKLGSACKPNVLVQHEGEFVITYPRGYHAGFNLGFNCAESVNFALDSWLELGRKAAYCTCVSDSVRINVDELLLQRADELENAPPAPAPSQTTTPTRSKRKVPPEDGSPANGGEYKKIRFAPANKLPQVLTERSNPLVPTPAPQPKRAPRPQDEATPDMPCCLCASPELDGLLPVHDSPPPGSGPGALPGVGPDGKHLWRAHETCARVVPETWVDEVDGTRWVFGVDVIVKDRWNLKCQLCVLGRNRMHGAPIQCAKGKCPRAFHVTCASTAPEGQGISYTVLGEVEKDVVLADAQSTAVATIRKERVELYCAQHNPSAAAEKKRSKDDKLRADLRRLERLSRIRVRVSSGVYEVSLDRVLEDEQAIEVFWADGVKRTFKWGSIVWGDSGTVQGASGDARIVAPTASTSTTPLDTTPTLVALSKAATVGTLSMPKGATKPKLPKSAASIKQPPPYPYYPPPPPGYYYAPYPYSLPPGATAATAGRPGYPPVPPMPPSLKPPPPGTIPPFPPGAKPSGMPMPFSGPPNSKSYGWYPPPPPNMRYYPSAAYQGPTPPPRGGMPPPGMYMPAHYPPPPPSTPSATDREKKPAEPAGVKTKSDNGAGGLDPALVALATPAPAPTLSAKT